MDFLWQDITHAAFWLAALKIIFVNIILSGDNAVVIAMACLTLPPKQRLWGMILGAGVAVLLRVIFTLVIAQAMAYPWLKLVGGALLFYVAIKLVTEDADGEDEGVEGAQTLWRAVRIVAIADIVMSLDNVIAIAASAEIAAAQVDHAHASAIKSTLKMDELRCLTPEMVEKEIWVHFLGYNLIRKVAAQAALEAGVCPRQISFAASQQVVMGAWTKLTDGTRDEQLRLGQSLLRALGKEKVGDRPNRWEPRAVKRRPKKQKLLTKPRKQARAGISPSRATICPASCSIIGPRPAGCPSMAIRSLSSLASRVRATAKCILCSISSATAWNCTPNLLARPAKWNWACSALNC